MDEEEARPIEEGETLGQRIRRIRNDRGMSLAKVVRDDFSRAFLNQVEMDKTRPSIRLLRVIAERLGTEVEYLLEGHEAGVERELALEKGDRKSTRLNSSHANISYAVFCLKKKKRKQINQKNI